MLTCTALVSVQYLCVGLLVESYSIVCYPHPLIDALKGGRHLNALVHFRCVIHGFFVCLFANFIVCLVPGFIVCLVPGFIVCLVSK